MIDSIIISTILLVKRFILIDYLRARKKTPFNPINIRFIKKNTNIRCYKVKPLRVVPN
jgi:hypothetical protein